MRLRLPERPSITDEQREALSGAGSGLLTRSAAGLISWLGPTTVIDPAAGRALVVASAHAVTPIAGAYLGTQSVEDFYHVGSTMRNLLPKQCRVVNQPVEVSLRENRTFDLAVLVGVAEMAEDPAEPFRLARERATHLMAASFVFGSEERTDPDPESLWQYDADGFAELLAETGWDPLTYSPIVMHEEFYDYQLWSAK